MTKKENNSPEMVYSMWQAAMNATEMARELSDPSVTKIKTGLESVDQFLNPFIGSNLISIIGRPGHAKTFFTDYMLMRTMTEIIEKGNEDSEGVVLINTEVPVEVTALKWMSRYSGVLVSKTMRGECTPEDIQKIDDSVYKVIGYPIFFVGYSEQRSKVGRKARPNLNPDTLNDALDYVINTFKTQNDQFLKIRLMVTDYLQQMQKPSNISNPDFYRDCVDWAKNAAVWAGAAHLLNVQAKEDVDSREVQIPMISDAQWTSNVGQTSTVVMSVHRPEQSKLKRMPAIWGQTPEVPVKPDMLYLALLKQKEAISNKVWLLKMGFNDYSLSEYT